MAQKTATAKISSASSSTKEWNLNISNLGSILANDITDYAKITNFSIHIEWKSSIAVGNSCKVYLNDTQVASDSTSSSNTWRTIEKSNLQSYVESMTANAGNVSAKIVCSGPSYRTFTLQNCTFTAYYDEPIFTVNASPNNSDYGSVTFANGNSATVGDTVTMTATPKTGYRFVKWSDGNTNASRTVTIADGSQTAYETKLSYTAVFEKLTYAITSSAGEGGSISPSGSTQVGHGDSQTYTITPNEGYEIESVTVDGVNQGAINSFTFSNVTAAHTISVTFKQIEVNPPEFTSASLTYAGSQVSASNKVPAGESCILSVGLT